MDLGTVDNPRPVFLSASFSKRFDSTWIYSENSLMFSLGATPNWTRPKDK